MSKYARLMRQILSGAAHASISFAELRQLGFEERISGSHHIFRKVGVEEKMVLQEDGNKAKPYQVRQVRGVILKYGIGGEI